jgi:hypothetical protein
VRPRLQAEPDIVAGDLVEIGARGGRKARAAGEQQGEQEEERSGEWHEWHTDPRGGAGAIRANGSGRGDGAKDGHGKRIAEQGGYRKAPRRWPRPAAGDKTEA